MSGKISLQSLGCDNEQNDGMYLFSDFVTFTKSDGYKEGCKRASFALQKASFTTQKGTFYNAKGALLEGERWSFKNQRGVYFTK